MEHSQKMAQQSVVKLPLHSHYEGLGAEFVESDGVLLPRSFQDVSTEVELLERGEALVDVSDRGILRMTGGESVALLHRISTNDFNHFNIGNLLQTSLLTEKGRVVDSILVLHRGDHLLLSVSRGATAKVQEWIEKFIIMEDVSITPEQEEIVSLIILSSVKTGEIVVEVQHPGYIGSTSYFGHDALFLLYPSSGEALSFLGSTRSKLVGYDAYEYFRISQGIPEYGKEIVSDFNPLELDLWDQVSSTKGCYIGQEVIARLETYKKIQRSLCTVRGSALLWPGDITRIVAAKLESGRITSVCPDHRDSKQFIGLAVVRQESAIQGRELPSENGSVSVKIEMVHDRHGVLEAGEASQ